ncbi:hypothetical protein ACFWQG_13205 [Rhodococcus sp. NPDC058532]|uniref:hypothetical protein n=1 Tax=Rhodococcus sp. NPDC058532 TaxID=3346540 RepID=UPI0036689672
MTALGLFVDCVLPGCASPVASVGEVCGGCRTAFGDQLRATGRPALTADEVAERDRSTRLAYGRRGFA